MHVDVAVYIQAYGFITMYNNCELLPNYVIVYLCKLSYCFGMQQYININILQKHATCDCLPMEYVTLCPTVAQLRPSLCYHCTYVVS